MNKVDHRQSNEDVDEFEELARAVKRLVMVIAEERKKKRIRGKLIINEFKNSK
jgi:hypothetical protein